MKINLLHKCLLLIILSIFSETWGYKANASESDSVKVVTSKNYVLIINFHLESIQWNGNIEDIVTRYLNKDSSTDVYSEHIKALDIKTMEDLCAEQERVFNKYINRPKAVVFIGPAAWPFFADVMNERWNDVPIINSIVQDYNIPAEKYFSGVKNIEELTVKVDETELKQKYNVTGIRAHNKIKENIELLIKVIPGISNIAFISDERVGSFLMRYKLKQFVDESYPGISVEFLNAEDIPTTELIEKVSKYDYKTGVIFYTWAMRGNNSEDYYIWNNIYKMVGGAASVPVFVLWDTNVSEGYVAGGYFNLMSDMSGATIDILKQVLSGIHARDIPFVSVNKEKEYLNYVNLAGLKSPNVHFPKSAYYFSKPEDLFYKYRYEITVISMLVLLIIIYGAQRIYFLGRERKKQREELDIQLKLQKQIELRNFKLALALDVSAVNPWVWNLKTDIINFDDVKRMMTDPNSCNTSDAHSMSEFLSWMDKSDRKLMRKIFEDIRKGSESSLKEDCRMCYVNDNGQSNWYMMQAAVYEKDNSGQPLTVIGTMTLITESKELELELINAKDKAEESNRLKSAFLANLSHEIRTPLNAIVGFSGVLAMSEDEEEKRELVNIVQYNNKLLLRLIGDIIDISKIESGAIEFSYSKTDVNAMLVSVKEEFEKEKDSSVDIIIDSPLNECFIKTEKRRVKQVVENLMLNAVKFTKRGTITLGYDKPENDKIRFYVKDTGCGIPKEQQEMIFGRFVKLNQFEQGTGLGLSICQLIVEKLEGEIGVISEYQKGAEFWFDIPYEHLLREDIDDNYKNGKANIQSEIKILIAEDSRSNYIVLRSMIDCDCEFIHAWNGKEAVELCRKYNPDLILMDIKMPILDGYDAVKEIRKMSVTVPIIAISAYAFDDDKERIASCGFNAYEPKPVDKDRLMKLINDFIKKSNRS